MSMVSLRTGKIYVPILKTKQGELAALTNLTSQQAAVIKPLLDLHEVTPFKNQASVAKFATRISQAWRFGSDLYVDVSLAASYQNPSLVPSPLMVLFQEFQQVQLSVIPVTDPYRPSGFQATVSQAANSFGRGICIRIMRDWLVNRAQLLADIATCLAQLHVSAKNTDLIIDLGDIPSLPTHAQAYSPWIVGEINALHTANPWRSIVLAGTSFPQIIQGNPQTILAFHRVEWALWNNVRQDTSLQCIPHFGDYACHSAAHLAPARYMSPSPKIRYTDVDRWLVIKGQSVKQAAPTQYYALAQAMIARPEFCGAQFSFGDSYVAQRGAPGTQASTGYFTQWLAADINHHLAYVAGQI